MMEYVGRNTMRRETFDMSFDPDLRLESDVRYHL